MQKGGWLQFDRVQEFLLETNVYDQFELVLGKYSLPQERVTELLDLADAVMYGQITINKMPELLGQAFGIAEDVSKKVAADIAGYRLLPLSAFIDGVEDAILSWGGKIEDYPAARISKPTLDDEIIQYASEIGLNLSDHLIKRFVYLSKGYLDKERDKQATTTLLKRPLTVGGLELTQEQVDRLLSALEQKFNVIQGSEQSASIDQLDEAPEDHAVVKELQEPEPPKAVVEPEVEKPRVESRPEKTTRKREMLPIKAVPTALTIDVPVISGRFLQEEEEGEIAVHKKALEKSGISQDDAQAQKRDVIVREVLDQIFSKIKGVKLTQKSAREIVESFVRGRIDEQRAHVLLQEKYHVSNDQIFAVLAILKDGYKRLHSQVQKSVPKKEDVVRKQERVVLDERLAALTATVPKETIEPILPQARVSATRTKEEELSSQRQKIDAQKVKEAQKKARPDKVKVRLSALSVPPSRGSQHITHVSDIQKAKVLIGPIEELGTMGIVEFRRLSSDPKEAIQKVLGTLQILEETDYDDRVRGVQAWRKSPLNQLYVTLVQDSLMNGMTVAGVAAKKRNAGEETLSMAEIDAIVMLNEQLHF